MCLVLHHAKVISYTRMLSGLSQRFYTTGCFTDVAAVTILPLNLLRVHGTEKGSVRRCVTFEEMLSE